jgi:hypothetical protein
LQFGPGAPVLNNGKAAPMKGLVGVALCELEIDAEENATGTFLGSLLRRHRCPKYEPSLRT